MNRTRKILVAVAVTAALLAIAAMLVVPRLQAQTPATTAPPSNGGTGGGGGTGTGGGAGTGNGTTGTCNGTAIDNGTVDPNGTVANGTATTGNGTAPSGNVTDPCAAVNHDAKGDQERATHANYHAAPDLAGMIGAAALFVLGYVADVVSMAGSFLVAHAKELLAVLVTFVAATRVPRPSR